MAMQNFALTPGRINKFKGQILAHAVPMECLGRTGRQVPMPKNQSDTYVARRWLPYGATATNASSQNQFFQNGTGDRGNVIVQAHQVQEGVTPAPDSIVPLDITVVMQQYSCLYGFTDKTYDLYEDDIPKAMIEQVGERVTFVNEMIIYGALRACTNQYFGGGGTTIGTVAGPLTLNLVRNVAKGLQANHAGMTNKMLKAGPDFGTDAVSEGFCVYGHTDLEPDIRDMPGYTPIERYASGKPIDNEVGKVERFRFVTSPDLPSVQNAGAAVGSTGCYSTSGSNIDVYQLVICGADAWSQLAVRGLEALDPVMMLPSERSKADPLGQRGYFGTQWWKAILLENQGWMAILNVGVRTLT